MAFAPPCRTPQDKKNRYYIISAVPQTKVDINGE